MTFHEFGQLVLRDLVHVPDEPGELPVDPESAEQCWADRTSRVDRGARAVLENNLAGLLARADDAVQRERRQVQLLVVRPVREFVETPQLLAAFVIRP